MVSIAYAVIVWNLLKTQLWNTYTLLTTVESSFRSLKTELGLRPIYNQKQATNRWAYIY